MLTAEQIVAAQKSNMETLFGLSTKAFEGMEKLVELNIQVAKAAMAEAADSAQAAMAAKDAQELLALQAAMMAGATLAVAADPPVTTAGGRSVSPSLTVMRDKGKPVSSPTICASTV